jgi:hypothetical protein
MKKLLFLIMIVSIPFVQGCKKDKDSDPDLQIREIAWNYLNSQAQATVNVDWRKVPVTETTYNGVSVYAVTFNTKDDALLGPIIVYVDVSSKAVLGQMLRM